MTVLSRSMSPSVENGFTSPSETLPWPLIRVSKSGLRFSLDPTRPILQCGPRRPSMQERRKWSRIRARELVFSKEAVRHVESLGFTRTIVFDAGVATEVLFEHPRLGWSKLLPVDPAHRRNRRRNRRRARGHVQATFS